MQQILTAPERERFLRRALELARRGWGETHPNPMVGAVIVEGGEIVAEGWHEAAGRPHAEINALRALARPPQVGATLFVTLEPCSTPGRTGACTTAILAAGLRHVVAGAVDPNPAHAGRGFTLLREAGVTVEDGLLAAEATDLNLIFNHWVTSGRPLFAGKQALTLDGRMATRSNESRWITGEAARADVMHWRRLFPAIAVGANTILADNPRLTARRPEGEWCPVRFVFDGLLRTVTTGGAMPAVYTDEFKERTIVVSSEHAGTGYVRRLAEQGVRVWRFGGERPRVPFAAFKLRCAAEGITGVLFEGGARLLSDLLLSREMDYNFTYLAPLFFADDKGRAMLRGLRTDKLAQAVRLVDVRHALCGRDVLVRGRVAYPDRLDADETIFSHWERA